MTKIADTLLIKGPLMISYCQNSFKIIFIYYYYYYVFPCVPHILFVSCHKKESRTPHSNKTNIYLMMMTRYHICHNVVLKIYNISSFPVWTFWITLLPSFFFFQKISLTAPTVNVGAWFQERTSGSRYRNSHRQYWQEQRAVQEKQCERWEPH